MVTRISVSVCACIVYLGGIFGAYYDQTPQSTKATFETSMQRQRHIQYDQTPLLESEEYKRYGRQMIMPEVGLDGW